MYEKKPALFWGEKPIWASYKSIVLLINLLVGVSALIIKTMNDAGEFKKLTPHFAGECFPVSGAIGAEDITILKNGIAIISCDDRRKTLNGTPVQGTIYAYDLKQEVPQLIDLTAGVKFEFHPHGISVFEKEMVKFG